MSRSWFAALALLSGCVSSLRLGRPVEPPIRPSDEPPPGLAALCVMRPQESDSIATYAVRVDGRLEGALRGPSWFCKHVTPGFHRVAIRVDDPGALLEPKETTFVVEPGQRVFLRQETHLWLGFIELAWIDERDAAAAIASARNLVLRGSTTARSFR